MKRYATGSLGLLLLLIQGCVVFPVSRTTTSGQPISRDDQRVIQIGRTTRDEILQRFGAADEEFPEVRVIVYNWKTSQSWFYLVFLPVKNPAYADRSEHNFNVLIAFDSANRAAKVETRDLSDCPTLRGAAYEFANAPTNFVARAIPSGQSLLYIYIPASHTLGELHVDEPVYLDGELLTCMRNGNFTWTIVAPGSHQINVPGLWEPGYERKPFPPIQTLADRTCYAQLTIQTNLPGKWNLLSRHFLEAWIPVLTLRSEAEAVPQLQKLTAKW